MLAQAKIFHKEILQITDQKFGYLDNCLSKQNGKKFIFNFKGDSLKNKGVQCIFCLSFQLNV